MRGMSRSWVSAGCLCALLLLLGTAVSGQQKAQVSTQSNRAYDMSRETVLQGTVVEYTAASTTPPLGAHVTVRTSSGVVDVHLGNAQLLTANQLTLSSGDGVRIVGENLAYGTSTQFVARLVQKGNQVLAVRSTRGFPLAPTNKAGESSKAGVL
jgi:hypothetical protein